MEKRRKKAEQVNNEIKQLLQIDREFEGFDEAKNKIVKFLKGKTIVKLQHIKKSTV